MDQELITLEEEWPKIKKKDKMAIIKFMNKIKNLLTKITTKLDAARVEINKKRVQNIFTSNNKASEIQKNIESLTNLQVRALDFNRQVEGYFIELTSKQERLAFGVSRSKSRSRPRPKSP
jgi:hypothetical protein